MPLIILKLADFPENLAKLKIIIHPVKNDGHDVLAFPNPNDLTTFSALLLICRNLIFSKLSTLFICTFFCCSDDQTNREIS